MYKQKLTLSVDNELINMAKERKINISYFLEEKLIELFNLKCAKSIWVKKGED